jgi:hypothetical protein
MSGEEGLVLKVEHVTATEGSSIPQQAEGQHDLGLPAACETAAVSVANSTNGCASSSINNLNDGDSADAREHPPPASSENSDHEHQMPPSAPSTFPTCSPIECDEKYASSV